MKQLGRLTFLVVAFAVSSVRGSMIENETINVREGPLWNMTRMVPRGYVETEDFRWIDYGFWNTGDLEIRDTLIIPNGGFLKNVDGTHRVVRSISTNNAVFNLFEWSGRLSESALERIETDAVDADLKWNGSDLTRKTLDLSYVGGGVNVIPEPAVLTLVAIFSGVLILFPRWLRS